MSAKKKYIDYVRTKKGLITKIYHSQKLSESKKSFKKVDYVKDELVIWCLNSLRFHSLYTDWVLSGYDKMLIPSIDRIDNNLGYNFDNIQLLTYAQNREKAFEESRNGELIINNPHKPITQYDLEGVKLNEFISISDASRKLNISKGNISLNLNGKRKTCSGYIFKLTK